MTSVPCCIAACARASLGELSLLVRAVVAAKQSALLHPPHDALADVREHRLELSSRWWGRLDKPQRPRFLFHVHAVRAERVEVDVQIQARARSVDAGDGARLRAARVRDSCALRPRAVVMPQGLPKDARQVGQHLGARRGEAAQVVWEREDILPQVDTRKNAVHEVRRLRRHPPPRAARAEATIFTRERHEQVVLAPRASEVDEASREVTAAQRTRAPTKRGPARPDPFLLRGLLHCCAKCARRMTTSSSKALVEAPPRRRGPKPRLPLRYYRCRGAAACEDSQVAVENIESRVIAWMTSNPSGISATSSAVLSAYAPHLKKAPPARQGRLLSQLVWEVRWDGRRGRFTVKFDELAMAQEHARLEAPETNDAADRATSVRTRSPL